MIVTFIGAHRRSGISSKTNNPYDICTLEFAVPLQEVTSAKMNMTGYGFESKKMDMAPDLLKEFLDTPAFSQIDISIEPKPSNFSQTWVVGLNKTKK